MEPVVSIIVPVYNVAPLLPACLASIRAQSWPKLEVFLINDGSKDDSLALCQAAQRADPRFHVIDQPNSGVSAARNAGLERASGKYLQFVDGDDYLHPDATRTLVHAAESSGADLVVAHFWRVVGENMAPRGHIRQEKVLTRQEYAQEMMKAPANYYYGVLWNKLYRRTILQQNRLRFDTALCWCEDFLFNLEYIRYTRLIAAVPKPVYYYVKREDSLVSTQSTLRKTIQMKRTTFSYYKELYQSLDLYEERKAQVYGYLVSVATDGSTLSLPEPRALLKPLSQKVEKLIQPEGEKPRPDARPKRPASPKRPSGSKRGSD